MPKKLLVRNLPKGFSNEQLLNELNKQLPFDIKCVRRHLFHHRDQASFGFVECHTVAHANELMATSGRYTIWQNVIALEVSREKQRNGSGAGRSAAKRKPTPQLKAASKSKLKPMPKPKRKGRTRARPGQRPKGVRVGTERDRARRQEDSNRNAILDGGSTGDHIGELASKRLPCGADGDLPKKTPLTRARDAFGHSGGGTMPKDGNTLPDFDVLFDVSRDGYVEHAAPRDSYSCQSETKPPTHGPFTDYFMLQNQRREREPYTEPSVQHSSVRAHDSRNGSGSVPNLPAHPLDAESAIQPPHDSDGGNLALMPLRPDVCNQHHATYSPSRDPFPENSVSNRPLCGALPGPSMSKHPPFDTGAKMAIWSIPLRGARPDTSFFGSFEADDSRRHRPQCEVTTPRDAKLSLVGVNTEREKSYGATTALVTHSENRELEARFGLGIGNMPNGSDAASKSAVVTCAAGGDVVRQMNSATTHNAKASIFEADNDRQKNLCVAKSLAMPSENHQAEFGLGIWSHGSEAASSSASVTRTGESEMHEKRNMRDPVIRKQLMRSLADEYPSDTLERLDKKEREYYSDRSHDEDEVKCSSLVATPPASLQGMNTHRPGYSIGAKVHEEPADKSSFVGRNPTPYPLLKLPISTSPHKITHNELATFLLKDRDERRQQQQQPESGSNRAFSEWMQPHCDADGSGIFGEEVDIEHGGDGDEDVGDEDVGDEEDGAEVDVDEEDVDEEDSDEEDVHEEDVDEEDVDEEDVDDDDSECATDNGGSSDIDRSVLERGAKGVVELDKNAVDDGGIIDVNPTESAHVIVEDAVETESSDSDDSFVSDKDDAADTSDDIPESESDGDDDSSQSSDVGGGDEDADVVAECGGVFGLTQDDVARAVADARRERDARRMRHQNVRVKAPRLALSKARRALASEDIANEDVERGYDPFAGGVYTAGDIPWVPPAANDEYERSDDRLKSENENDREDERNGKGNEIDDNQVESDSANERGDERNREASQIDDDRVESDSDYERGDERDGEGNKIGDDRLESESDDEHEDGQGEERDGASRSMVEGQSGDQGFLSLAEDVSQALSHNKADHMHDDSHAIVGDPAAGCDNASQSVGKEEDEKCLHEGAEGNGGTDYGGDVEKNGTSYSEGGQDSRENCEDDIVGSKCDGRVLSYDDVEDDVHFDELHGDVERTDELDDDFDYTDNLGGDVGHIGNLACGADHTDDLEGVGDNNDDLNKGTGADLTVIANTSGVDHIEELDCEIDRNMDTGAALESKKDDVLTYGDFDADFDNNDELDFDHGDELDGNFHLNTNTAADVQIKKDTGGDINVNENSSGAMDREELASAFKNDIQLNQKFVEDYAEIKVDNKNDTIGNQAVHPVDQNVSNNGLRSKLDAPLSTIKGDLRPPVRNEALMSRTPSPLADQLLTRGRRGLRSPAP